MKAITKYKTADGAEFNTAAEAEAHEQLVARIEQVMAPLGDTPQAVKDGKGWVQHDLKVVNTAKDGILELCRQQGLNKYYEAFNQRGRNCHPLSFIGRALDDIGGPLRDAWSRFCRIDPQGREHQQPYYAYTMGPLPEHICVEDRR